MRFYIVRDPDRRGIDGKPSSIREVMFKRTPNSEPKEFAHTWQYGDDYGPEYGGKWAFNRSTVCIDANWWPEVHHFDSLEDLLAHCETFKD